jgi:hypothetical protein
LYAAKDLIGKAISDWATPSSSEDASGVTSSCALQTDKLGKDRFAVDDALKMARLVEELATTDPSCDEKCPLHRPLCKGGSCVQPTCDDFKNFCYDLTDAGVLARLVCGVTCGCSDYNSDLFYIGQNYGCGPCDPEETSECSDAQPNQGVGPALAAFALRNHALLPGRIVQNATFWRTLGCLGLHVANEPKVVQVMCNTVHDSLKTEGKKSFMQFCPVTCGCTVSPDVPGDCPSACKPQPSDDNSKAAMPPCKDLSDAQLAVASDFKMEDFKMAHTLSQWPRRCGDVTPAICNRLLQAAVSTGTRPGDRSVHYWAHPCPVACSVCPQE